MEEVTNIAPMLTTNEVARIIRVHVNTVRRWSNQGVLKTYYISLRGDRRYKREDIANFLRQRFSKIEKVGFQKSNFL